eukprot:CAMPEP_0198317834 /NCGR_PEP_ID=MMETSP1450-20131203/7245_1 /TAXON_ID=753684 ORGANISM="Madagascaria erythrocladiodes, Strain CCMP3234" /NCGR_SAMPLE_ID=MMETSP1450 /ASSEMBLY_ACC=CAM_ASM_001115 /LENGTH=78 /DNA_ID=CAMNT_0044021081 /DNA_START=93 /DNA_END=329 /DNA_ORIENTATION=+
MASAGHWICWFCFGSGCNRCVCLGDIVGGIIHALTDGLCYIGCILDAIHMNELVELKEAGKKLPLIATDGAIDMARNS